MDPILSHGEATPTAFTGLQTHEKPANAKASKGFIKRRSLTPDLQVPKASQLSNMSERYLSPTDLLISPISRRLLAKNRKGVNFLPKSKN
ncbi:hypothetical protein KFK09_005923 [Dendrobium nobile]|uniref:Uncharacterized protein n=1 Tax=Dendrobium nobile TaxID=94219 RepID=A0A8T3C0K4_DENNO|nr:hypothetical protein KFK09_005923 [Dendrobium nobile]